jgi:hypothetical protein
MGGEVTIGYEDGSADAWSEYGHKPGQTGFRDEKRHQLETKTLYRFKGEFASLYGRKRRGSDPPPIKESTLNSDSAIHNGLFYWSAQDGEEELFDRADHRFIAAGGGYAVAGQDAGCGHS